MEKILGSNANCLECELMGCNALIHETNSSDNLEDVDIIFVGGCASPLDIKHSTPLYQQMNFRSVLSHFISRKCKYVITNSILCDTSQIEEINDDLLERCSRNLFSLINICKPK